MSSMAPVDGKTHGRTRPAALTACEACRKLKMRCIRLRPTAEQSGDNSGDNRGDNGAVEPCERCRRNNRACTIPEARPLGRRHGATGRYQGLEKAYRRMQAELKKAQMRGDTATIEEALQSLPSVDVSDIADVADVPDFTEITEIPQITEIPEISEIPEMRDIPDAPNATDMPEVPAVPPDNTRDRGSMAGLASPTPASFPYDEPAQPDSEPMSNPLALLADASSDAAQALECGSVAMMTSPRSCTSVASSAAATAAATAVVAVHGINAASVTNIGRRVLRRPGYVSLGLRLSRDTLEQGLDALFAPTPNTHPHANYFKRPSWAPMRDVGPDVDPVDLGLVTMEEATALFPFYFARLHPINGILDPVLHTPEFVRSRSALLFTWILALTAQFDHGSASIAKRLRLHGEKLSNHVHACGFKSVEIIQGYYISLLSANPAATLAEERSWLYTMYAFGLGSELGLDQQSEAARHTRGPRGQQQQQHHYEQQHHHHHHHLPPSTDTTYAERLARNRERTWLRILLWERANSAAHGRMHSFPETELTRNVERWWLHPLANLADKHTCAFILLRRTLAALQRELHRQATVPHAHDPHWVRNLVDATLRPWGEAWLPARAASDLCGWRQRSDDDGDVNDNDGNNDGPDEASADNTGRGARGVDPCVGPSDNPSSPISPMPLADTYLLHVYLHGRLWTLSFALHSSISSDRVQLDAIRQDCFEAAVQCCETAVRDLQALGEPLYCMLAPTWAMISYAGVLALSLFPTLYGSGSSGGGGGGGGSSSSTSGSSSAGSNVSNVGHLGLFTGNTNGSGSVNVAADAELLALVSQVALQLARAGTTPSHRYGIAALLGHHLVTILRTRAFGVRDQAALQPPQSQSQSQLRAESQQSQQPHHSQHPQHPQHPQQLQQPQQLQHPPELQQLNQPYQPQQQQQMPMPPPLAYPQQPYPYSFSHPHSHPHLQPHPEVYASGDVDSGGWRGSMAYQEDGVGTASAATSMREYAPSMVDPNVSIYNPLWTTAIMSTEGDLTGEGFADLFRDMFGSGFGGVF
ncbi:hypothetical protein SCUCBS95973_008994 [Sporothrix curviconia]|uniref:Zn(2)-C6 fungal-type domain-containing protein n=1 Tax=Sporothrix curviconia TaxID=1260050 RepID=A0ABP0CST7_9PEZI